MTACLYLMLATARECLFIPCQSTDTRSSSDAMTTRPLVMHEVTARTWVPRELPGQT